MKKIIIAGASVAALGLAILPYAGTFADVTDTVTITINGSCSVGSTTSTTGAGASLSATVANGGLQTWDADGTNGGKIVVSCNEAGGWNVKAVGASTGSSNTAMTPTSASSTPIATGTSTSGATSNWMFKVAGNDVESGYQGWSAVPSQATKVAGATGAISEGEIYTGYQVFVSATQQADTYTGRVTYTVSEGVNS